MNLLIIFVTLLISKCSCYKHPFDFVEDAMHNVVNWDSDPCEDFYRHACPIDYTRNGSLITIAFSEMVKNLRNIRPHESWRNEKLLKSNRAFPQEFLSSPGKIIDFFKTSLDVLCESKNETVPLFLSKVENVFNLILRSMMSFRRIENLNVKCGSTLEDFNRIKNAYFSDDLPYSRSYLTHFYDNMTSHVDSLATLYAHMDLDVLPGISETSDMFKDILKSVYKSIENTPWAVNNKKVEKIQKLVDKMEMHENVKQLTKNSRFLTEIADNFEKCLLEFDIIDNVEMLCYIFTSIPLDAPDNPFTMEDNAGNLYNYQLDFGFPNFYHTTFGKWLPAKLGYTGFTVGHEIGHTFVEVHDEPDDLGYFSNISEKCIQDQFEKLCNVYAEVNITEFEGGCIPPHSQFDDNGADIFGIQFAYELLQNGIGKAMGEKVKGLEAYGVTNEQLFFYSYAFGFCQGENSELDSVHSAPNFRINSVAQHPGFQKAFLCSESSKMMQAASEQCIIYGKDAPPSRRKFLTPRGL